MSKKIEKKIASNDTATALAVDKETKSFLQSLIEECYVYHESNGLKGCDITLKGYELTFGNIAKYEYINFLLVKSYVKARPFLPSWLEIASRRVKCDNILLVPDMRELVQNTIVDCIAVSGAVNGKAITEKCWQALNDFVIKTGYQQKDSKTQPKVEFSEIELVDAINKLCDKNSTDTPTEYDADFITALTHLFNEVKEKHCFFSPAKWETFKCYALNMPSNEICQLKKLTKQGFYKHRQDVSNALIECLKTLNEDELFELQSRGLIVD